MAITDHPLDARHDPHLRPQPARRAVARRGVPRNRGNVLTMLGALSPSGMTAMMTVEGATTKEVFDAFVEHLLLPKLAPGGIVVLDNLGAHRSTYAEGLLRARGVWFKRLPPYSPDLNPIELAWSKLKEILRSSKARTLDALEIAIRNAMNATTVDDALAWIGHCGYEITAQ
jgi:transposase